jgi:hypothetical protein
LDLHTNEKCPSLLAQHEAKVSGVGVGNIQAGREKLGTVLQFAMVCVTENNIASFLACLSSLEEKYARSLIFSCCVFVSFCLPCLIFERGE